MSAKGVFVVVYLGCFLLRSFFSSLFCLYAVDGVPCAVHIPAFLYDILSGRESHVDVLGLCPRLEQEGTEAPVDTT